MSQPPLLSLKEVAERLGVEYKTVYRLVRRGELAAAKIGHVYRLRASDVDAYIEQQIAVTRAAAPPESGPAVVKTQVRRRCEACLRLIREGEQGSGTCRHTGCEATLCAACRGRGEQFCRRHAPTSADRLAAARAARAAGQIPVLITAAEARRRELNFLYRFDQKIQAAAHWPGSGHERPVRVADWRALQTTADERAWLQQQGRLSSEQLQRLPLNARSRYRLLAGRAGQVLEARTLAHLDRYARDGFDTEPMQEPDLWAVLQAYTTEATATGDSLLVALAAATGWSEAATRLVVGKQPGDRWTHTLVAVCLVDLETRALYHADPRIRPLLPYFALPLPEEEVQAVEQFVSANIKLQSSLAQSDIQSALGVTAGSVQTAFQRLLAQGGYLIEDVPGIGPVIARL